MTEAMAIYQDKALEIATGNEMYFDIQKFDQAQRVAKMLSASTMVPEQFRNNIGNCMIALNFAARTRLDPFMIMQKMYVIQGRPGIEGQLVIALINNSGRFTPLQFRLSGAGKERQCTAFAKDKKTSETCEQTVTWDIVEKEGWNKKTGSKWNTMPDLMFQYRAAAFFGRLYCPEALLGMMTKEELYDIETPQAPATITNLADKLRAIDAPKKPESTPDTENLLFKTPEYKKWLETKEMFLEVVVGWQEPINTTQCIEAVREVNRIVDEGGK